MAEKKPFFIPPEMQPTVEVNPVVEKPAIQNTVEKQESKKEPYLPVINLTDIPSKFLPYPQGVEISYYPYKFGELKKFAQSKLSIKQRYEFILDGILVTGMPKEKLTFNDFLFIALLRKMSSVGVQDISVKFKCLKCNFENTHHVKLNQLDFDGLDIPSLPATIVINNKEMSFSPLTVEDFFSLFREGKENDPVGILSMQCRNLTFKQSYDLIYNANPEDSEMLDELNTMFYHGLATMSIPCENKEALEKELLDGVEIEKNVHCKYINKIELGDPDLIVQPFRRDGRTAKDRIRFGNGDADKSK
jgi:hypothetical protein